ARIACILQAAHAAHDGFEIRHLESDMVERSLLRIGVGHDMVQVVAAQEIHDARPIGQLEAECVHEHARSRLAVARVEYHVRYLDRARAVGWKRYGCRVALRDEAIGLALGTGDMEARAAAGLVEFVDPWAMLQTGVTYPIPGGLDFPTVADE